MSLFDSVVIFSADWCAGCKTVKNTLTARGVTFREKDIDTDSVMEEAAQLGIRGIPVTMFYKGDEVVQTVVGGTPNAIKSIIEFIGTEVVSD